MKLIRRQPEPVPQAPEPEPAMAEGVCPKCTGGREVGIWPCDLCGDSGSIRFRPAWTDVERDLLRARWSGIGIVSLAIELRRPMNSIYAEASRLGLPDREPAFVQLRPVMIKE